MWLRSGDCPSKRHSRRQGACTYIVVVEACCGCAVHCSVMIERMACWMAPCPLILFLSEPAPACCSPPLLTPRNLFRAPFLAFIRPGRLAVAIVQKGHLVSAPVAPAVAAEPAASALYQDGVPDPRQAQAGRVIPFCMSPPAPSSSRGLPPTSVFRTCTSTGNRQKCLLAPLPMLYPAVASPFSCCTCTCSSVCH